MKKIDCQFLSLKNFSIRIGFANWHLINEMHCGSEKILFCDQEIRSLSFHVFQCMHKLSKTFNDVLIKGRWNQSIVAWYRFYWTLLYRRSSTILWNQKTGANWCTSPTRYPDPLTCWRLLNQWKADVIHFKVYPTFIARADHQSFLECEKTFII